MNLDEFEPRLAAVLRDADLRTVAVITSQDPDAFVQFMIDEIGTKGELLITQAGGTTLSVEGETHLQTAGFNLDPVMVNALQDRGITTTEGLTDKAWRDPERVTGIVRTLNTAERSRRVGPGLRASEVPLT